MKYPRAKILDPRNSTRKNFGTTKYLREKKLGLTKYPRKKNWDSRNTHEKMFWIHEIPTRKYFGPTKYPRRHNGTMALHPQDPR